MRLKRRMQRPTRGLLLDFLLAAAVAVVAAAPALGEEAPAPGPVAVGSLAPPAAERFP